MTRIRLLPALTVNRIAAGEVIERPAAAVKELVENALDAGADRVAVALAGGGIERIEVTDTGEGMTAEELGLAVLRHATSKLTDENLTRIATLGFRGEALPSIGAAARLSITSRPAGAAHASCISVEGGAVSPVAPSAGPPGTRVVVRDLFFATPARRKFLKAPRTEADHAEAAVRRLALAAPAVAFRLEIDGRVAFDLPPQDRAARVAALLGAEAAAALLPIEAERGANRLAGFVCAPTVHRATAAAQAFTVNGRPVADPVLKSAVRVAYREVIVAARHAVVALWLDLPHEDLDVNVHPTKNELRFRDAGAIRSLLIGGIGRVLAGGAGTQVPAAGLGFMRPQLRLTHPRGYRSSHAWASAHAVLPLGSTRLIFGPEAPGMEGRPEGQFPRPAHDGGLEPGLPNGAGGSGGLDPEWPPLVPGLHPVLEWQLDRPAAYGTSSLGDEAPTGVQGGVRQVQAGSGAEARQDVPAAAPLLGRPDDRQGASPHDPPWSTACAPAGWSGAPGDGLAGTTGVSTEHPRLGTAPARWPAAGAPAGLAERQRPLPGGSVQQQSPGGGSDEQQHPSGGAPAERLPNGGGLATPQLPLGGAPAARVMPPAAPRPEHPLGAAVAQVLDTYVIAVATDGSLVLVDQHAAHERLTHEAIRAQMVAGGVRSQPLLLPAVVDLPPGDAARLLARSEDLERLGLEIEGFGPGAVLVRALPALLGAPEPAPLLRDLADELAEMEETTVLAARIDAVIARLACHGSVRAGRRLSQPEMNALLRQMEATPRAATCSHGRPTVLKLTRAEIELLFGRR